MLRMLALFSLEESNLRGIWLMRQWGMCVEKMELDSPQRCASRAISSRDKLQLAGFHPCMKENHKHQDEPMWDADPEVSWSLPPLSYSKLKQTRCWDTCCGLEVSPALNRGLDWRPPEIPFDSSCSVGSHWGQVLWRTVKWGAHTVLSARMNHKQK